MLRSLVGSEMCIRDRRVNADFLAARGAAMVLEDGALADPDRGLAALAIPVSYTHLTLPTIYSV